MSRSLPVRPVRGYRPTVELLEDRTTPAGNVSAAIVGGNLFVVGDNAANRIVIAQMGGSQIAVAAMDFTSINGIAGSSPVVLDDFSGGIYIAMGGGDDVLSLIGLRPYTDLTVDMEAGNDALWMTGVQSNRFTSLRGGDGDDSFTWISSSFGPSLHAFGFENQPLVRAGDNTATVAEGGTVTINLIANDSVSRGSLDPTSIVITQQPANGTVTVNNNGTVTYTHNGSETTGDTFKYRISDQLGNVSNQATVTITITPVNDAPTANNDAATVDEGDDVTINVAANDTDPENALDLTSIVIVGQPTNGTVTVNNNGTVTYTHNGSETTTDSFTYTIKDAVGSTSNTATVTITITPVNDAPTAEDDEAALAPGATIDIPVSVNDDDPEGELDLTSIVITQQPTNGTVIVNNDGTVTYTHDGSATTSDSFSYTVADAQGLVSNVATVTVAITEVPVANDDDATLDEGNSVVIDLAANDSDADGTLDLGSIVIVQQPQHGTVTVHADGTVTYQHDGSETTTDSFTYTIRDNVGAVSNEATVTITIMPVNDAPVAIADSGAANEGGSVIIDLAGNDTDADGTIDVTSIVITQQPANGTLTLNGDGTVTYQHDGSETTADSFTYTILDDQGAISSEATVTVTIVPVNDAPTANDDDATVNPGTSVVISLTLNDLDPEGKLDPATLVITQQPASGTVTVHADGTVTYQHDGSATASDLFRYTITDQEGAVSNEAMVTITIDQPDA